MNAIVCKGVFRELSVAAECHDTGAEQDSRDGAIERFQRASRNAAGLRLNGSPLCGGPVAPVGAVRGSGVSILLESSTPAKVAPNSGGGSRQVKPSARAEGLMNLRHD
jgi:hypothetical protein